MMDIITNSRCNTIDLLDQKLLLPVYSATGQSPISVGFRGKSNKAEFPQVSKLDCRQLLFP